MQQLTTLRDITYCIYYLLRFAKESVELEDTEKNAIF